MKTDLKRFPRAQDKNSNNLDILSTFSETNLAADALGFKTLMKHIRKVDGKAHTVLMVQVENEEGVLGDSRERSVLANKAFNQPVPNQLIHYLVQHKDTLMSALRMRWEAGDFKTSGNWEEVFGVSEYG